MKINPTLLAELISDLGLNVLFVKGEDKQVKNCWHFCTDGNALDAMFYDDEDFIAGMNRIYVTSCEYEVVILAFTLMDTHIHFILYGELGECNRFIHEYIRRTSWYISTRHGESHKLEDVPISHQAVDTDAYLKTVICYTLKNAPVGGIGFNAWTYPWSSGPLYFQRTGYWSSPSWKEPTNSLKHELSAGILSWNIQSSSEKLSAVMTDKPQDLTVKQFQKILRTRNPDVMNARMIGKVIFPGEYVAYEIVERLFKTCKSFNYFMCKTKDDDVDNRGGTLSHLSIPMQEMRQHKNEVCRELFGIRTIKGLDTTQRLLLARTLRARYNSSLKQIVRLCGLVYDEVKTMF